MPAGDLRLPSDKRDVFKRPIGRELKETELSKLEREHPLITVGDVVSLTMREHGIVPDVSVYDGMTERREMTGFARLVSEKGLDETSVVNPAGMITAALTEAVRNALAGHAAIIRVEGEEDLAVIPFMLLAPEGTNIVYGWPGRGMMVVTTDAGVQEEARQLISMMEESE